MNRSSRITIAIFLLLFGFTAIFFSFESNQKHLVSWLDDIPGRDKELVEVSYFMGDDLTYHNGRYFSWDGEKISYLADDSEVLWSRTFLFDEPQLRIKDSMIAVFNNEGELYVYTTEGKERFSKDIEENIFDVRILQGDIVIHTKSDQGESLLVFNSDGTERLRKDFVSEIPLNYWKDSKGELSYSVIESSTNSIVSKLYTEKEEEPLYTIESELILKTIPYGSGSIILTDEGIKLHKRGQIQWEKAFPLIRDVAVDGEDIYILYGDNLELLDKSGQTVNKITNSIEYKGLHNHGRYVIMYGNRDLSVFRDGENKCSYSTGGRIKVLSSQFNDLIITMEEGISVMRIKDIENKEQEEEQ